jgi:hypothetical protein
MVAKEHSMNRRFLLILVSLLLPLTLVASPASEMPQERTAPPAEVVITHEQRVVLDPPVVPYGLSVGIVNRSGYTLLRFDLYSSRMARTNPEPVNLLKAPLVSGTRTVIPLLEHLLLFNELAARDGELFYYTAVDESGDYFYGTWNPAIESWNIQVTFNDYRSDFLRSQWPAFGNTLALINKSPSPLVSFSLEGYHYLYFDGGEKNLLSGLALGADQYALIPVSSIDILSDLAPPEWEEEYLTLYYSALDANGVRYRGSFYPDEDPWVLIIDEDGYAGSGDTFYTLQVENRLDESIWYLYVMTAQEYLSGDWGEDLLYDGILSERTTEAIDLYRSERLSRLLSDGWEGRLYILAQTYEGDEYLSYVEVGIDYPFMYVPIDSSRMVGRTDEPMGYEEVEVVLYNFTGEDLAALYVSRTDEELLEGLVWEDDTYVTLSIDTSSYRMGERVVFTAYSQEGSEFSTSWRLGDARLITLDWSSETW